MAGSAAAGAGAAYAANHFMENKEDVDPNEVETAEADDASAAHTDAQGHAHNNEGHEQGAENGDSGVEIEDDIVEIEIDELEVENEEPISSMENESSRSVAIACSISTSGSENSLYSRPLRHSPLGATSPFCI